MALNPGRALRALLALAALLVAAAVVDGARLWRDERTNAALQARPLPPAAQAREPELQFARAHAQAASGALEAALDGYCALQGDTALGQAARYNSANLLLRQALKLREGSQPGQAIPLIELAKETYREVLRHDPGHWNARYNLERAQRLLPDAEDGDGGPATAPHNAERAATTMRGYSPGLP
jgi:mxaK protein